MITQNNQADKHPNRQNQTEHSYKIRVKDLNFYYNQDNPVHALKNINLNIPEKKATALIGPSGCGKSTLLKVLNRMSDLVDNCRIEGDVLLDNHSIFSPETNIVQLRKKVGMVFQRSNPFPKNIFDNIVYGPRLFGEKNKIRLSEIVESTLHSVGLWDEVKDRLYESALGLSGGQQQRLCIARALAVNPEVLLMDEPASALDPIGSGKIEELIFKLKKIYTIIVVTHNMQQAARVSDYTAFFYYGELVELNSTEKIFTNPDQKATEDYVTGRFG